MRPRKNKFKPRKTNRQVPHPGFAPGTSAPPGAFRAREATRLRQPTHQPGRRKMPGHSAQSLVRPLPQAPEPVSNGSVQGSAGNCFHLPYCEPFRRLCGEKIDPRSLPPVGNGWKKNRHNYHPANAGRASPKSERTVFFVITDRYRRRTE